MRIALDVQGTLGRKTGIGLYTHSLLQALRRVAPQHEYVELSWGRTEDLRTDWRIWWEQVELPRRARRARAEVLHVPGFAAPRWPPCPTLLTVHDLIGWLFPQNFPPVSRFYWSRYLPRSARWADRIIASSEHTRGDLIRFGIPPERIEAIPLGVDPAYRPIAERAVLDAVRSRYCLPETFLLYLGTLEPRKGLDTLIAAYAKLSAQDTPDLVIAGKKGWYTAPLFQQVEALGLAGRVHFTDYVLDEDLVALYNLAQVFVFPSRYEGFGLPPLEALACGVPVVCSNAASLPEVVGDAALTVAPDDVDGLATALARVLADPALRVQMRARGLAQAAHFSWDETARRTLRLYEALGVRC